MVESPSISESIREREFSSSTIDSWYGEGDVMGETFLSIQTDGGAILADDMGLGKSIQTIAATWAMLRRKVL